MLNPGVYGKHPDHFGRTALIVTAEMGFEVFLGTFLSTSADVGSTTIVTKHGLSTRKPCCIEY